ncbi:MAG: cell wall-binding repeat-containing protein, partial [Actinobacteria bacterium]
MSKISRLLVLLVFVALALSAAPAFADPWPADVPHFSIPVTRLGGSDRFVASTAIARAAYPGWTGVNTVVLASGDDGALADPLAAGSLCWAYDAPLMLVSAKRIPAPVVTALKEIASVNPTVTVLVVGGNHSVPAGRITTLRGLVPSGTVTQPWKLGDRYQLARSIAARTRSVAATTGRSIPSAVMIANGANPAAFFDALSAASVSAQSGVPVLLTRATVLPVATQLAISESGATSRIIL